MTDIPNATLLDSPIPARLDRSVRDLQTLLNRPENKDAVFHSFRARGLRMCLAYMDGMADTAKIADFILRPILSSPLPPPAGSAALASFLREQTVQIPQIEEASLYRHVVSAVLSGMTALLADGMNAALLLDTRGFEKRNVDRANNESVVIGSQEGFVESLRTNLTLLRRYCQSQQLITEFVDVGTKIQSKVAVVYLKGVIDESILRELRDRLRRVGSPFVQGIGQLQQHIEDSWLALLPQMLQTERPDRAVSCLLDGQFVLLMDNSPFALVAPVTLAHLVHAPDDSFMRWQYGTFLRCVRIAGILVSLLLPGCYVALTLYHPHLLPMPLLSSIAEARANIPFSVLTEALIMEFSFYLINEAGTRMPSQLGSALGIVGGLILGQAAVAADIISPIMIIIVALTGLGNYVILNYDFSVAAILCRLVLIFSGAFAGLYGIILALFCVACRLCAMRSFGVPYMAPIAPWRPHNPDIVLRLPLWMQKTRMFFSRPRSWLSGEAGRK